VWVASGLLFVVCLMWAVLTPGTRAPDEVQHLNSIIRIAEGGGWPEPGDAHVLEGVIEAMDMSGASVDGARTYLPGSVNARPGAPMFVDLPPPTGDQRESFGELDDGTLTRSVDQMTQHPPGYYAATALIYKIVGAEDWRFDRAIFFLRALTALTIAVSVPVCVYVATREITGRESLGRMAAFLPLFIPQLGFIGGAVTNDGLTVAVAAVLTALLVKVMGSGPTFGRLAAIAVTVAVGCWTKGTVIPLIAAVPVALVVARYRRRADGARSWWVLGVRDTFLTLGAAFVLGGWWWALNLVRYGTLQPAGMGIPIAADAPLLSVGQYADVFQWRVSASYFGDIGLLEAPMPPALTRTLTYAFLALALVGLWSRRRIAERVVFILLSVPTAAILFVRGYEAHVQTHNLPGLQGRYLFVLLVPTLALVAIGLGRVVRLVRVPSVVLVPAVALVGLLIALAGLLLGFRTYYLPAGQSLGFAIDHFLGWSAWSWPVMATLPALAIAMLLALAFRMGRDSGPVADSVPDSAAWDEPADDGVDDGWLDLRDHGATEPLPENRETAERAAVGHRAPYGSA
jgi:4-amino-4-deoxy-L-arabinose transferase-like glycosyltransferase